MEAAEVVIGDYDTYKEASAKEYDVSTAKTIDTAVSTAMGIEVVYNDLTQKHADEYILVTESGLSVLDSVTQREILACLSNNIPSAQYTAEGYTTFAFKVDSNGGIEVYVTNGSDYIELVPETDSSYE